MKFPRFSRFINYYYYYYVVVVVVVVALHAERCKEAFSSGSLTSGSQPSLTGKVTSSLEQVQEQGAHLEFTPLYSESFEVSSTDDHKVTSVTVPSGERVTSQSKSQPIDAVNITTASSLSEGNFDVDSLQAPAEEGETESTNSLSCISLVNEEDDPTTDMDQYSQTTTITQEHLHKSDSLNGSKTIKAHLSTDTQPPVSQ